MSYILEALSKSERERARHQKPGLETIARLPPPSTKGRWLVTLVALAVINTALFGAWLVWQQQPAPPVAKDVATAELPGIASPAPGAVTVRVPEAPIQPAPVPSPPSQAPLATPVNSTPIPITALPAEIREHIPPLSFSSHIYAQEPSFRVVNINGNRLREGEQVTADIRLIAITEDGVVLQSRGYRFTVGVLEEWAKTPGQGT